MLLTVGVLIRVIQHPITIVVGSQSISSFIKRLESELSGQLSEVFSPFEKELERECGLAQVKIEIKIQPDVFWKYSREVGKIQP